MDVKSVSLYNESRSLDIVRTLVRRDNTDQTTVQAKVHREQGWTRKSAISVHAAEIAETVLSSKEPVIGDAAVVEPPLAIHETQPQDPQPPQSLLHTQTGDLDHPLHPHPIVKTGPQPPQFEPIPTQGLCPKSVGHQEGGPESFFVRRRMMHGLLCHARKPLFSAAG
jgi:hypothetical protein